MIAYGNINIVSKHGDVAILHKIKHIFDDIKKQEIKIQEIKQDAKE